MAYNTKIDLYNGKVEQRSDEALHLSGCTFVYGQFEIQSGATFSILDNAGNGKVLTSNVDGLGTWQIPSLGGEITGATNGLTKSGQDVVLGGNLTGNTCININNFDFKLYDSTPTAFIEICDSTCTTTFGSTSVAATNIFQGTCTCLTQSLSGAIFTDNSVPIPMGLQYASDYSSGYTARSLVDAAYVTGHTSGGEITGGTNGLTKSGQDVVLGGTLTSNTTFDGVSNYTLNYANDVSPYYTCLSIPNAGWVTGKTNQAIIGATNGLTKSCQNVVLGGTLTGNITFGTSGNFTLNYDVDNSAYYTALSIPDAGWVTGTTLPANYYNKVQINSYTGVTATAINSKLNTSTFTTYTGTTVPNTYYNKVQINSYTGATNVRITNIENTYITGTTTSATFILGNGVPITLGANKTNVLYIPNKGKIVKALAYAKTPPTGANAIFDINVNGVSIWNTTQVNRLEILAGNTTGSQTSFDTVNVNAQDVLTIDIDQIGSIVAGQNITVQLFMLVTK